MLALLLMAQAATAQPMPAFLASCWEQRNGERWDECWTGPAARK